MNLSEIYQWAVEPAKNADLKKQLAAAIAVAAVSVLNESKDTPFDERRKLWAASVLATPDGPGEAADQWIWGVLGNPSIQASLAAPGGVVPDSDLQYTVNSLVNTYAP